MKDKYKGKKVVGVIPARMQSSRFYGKPLAKILGKEMLCWVYEYCMKCRNLKDVYVAIDHQDLQDFCEQHKMRYLMTSPDHKNGSERCHEAGQRLGAEFVVEVQGDEPTLQADDLDSFIDRAFDFDEFDVVTQYVEISEKEAHNPNNVKVAVGPQEKALFFSRSAIPYNFKNKDPKYYKQIGLYVWQAASIARFTETPRSYLETIEDTHMLRLIENGFNMRLVPTDVENIGVDVPEDIPQAEAVLLGRQQSAKNYG